MLHYYERYDLAQFFAVEQLQQFELVHFQPGETICRSGEEVDSLYFLVEGRTKVYMTTENGRQLLLSFQEPLQLIGDIELFYESREASSTVEAICPSVCLKVKEREWLLNDATFLRQLARFLSYKLVRVKHNSALHLLHPLEHRVASYIRATANDGLFQTNLTQMAEMLGTSFRHLHRTLQQLCAKHVLQKEKTAYYIVNEAELARLAGGIYLMK